MDLLEKNRLFWPQQGRAQAWGAAEPPLGPNGLNFGGLAPLGLLSWPRGCTLGVRLFCVGLGLISFRLGPDLSGNRLASPWAHVGYMFCWVSCIF
jgi:hypothetical protein